MTTITTSGASQDGLSVLGLRIDSVDYSNVAERVEAWIARRSRPPAVIVQANAYSCVTALDDLCYRQLVNATDLSLPDGMSLVWVARRLGYPLMGRIYGPELMLRLAAVGGERQWRVFLYGGAPGVAAALGVLLQQRFPGLDVVGDYSPPFRQLNAAEDEAVCDLIGRAEPDIVWVSLGGPKQDRWMMEHRERLNASVLHGVGAAFDFLTGRVRQAPRWMQRRGLEWAYRLYREPRRLWRRYLIGNARFLFHAIPEIVRERGAGGRISP